MPPREKLPGRKPMKMDSEMLDYTVVEIRGHKRKAEQDAADWAPLHLPVADRTAEVPGLPPVPIKAHRPEVENTRLRCQLTTGVEYFK